MVRTYVRTTERAAYSKESLEEAVQAVKNGELSGYKAAQIYKIPRATILARVYEKKGLKSQSLGRATVLSPELEKSLANNLHVMEKYGFGLTRKEVLELVGDYVKINKIENPFKDGVPGEDWFLSFKKRHNLSVKKPQPVEQARKKACNPYVIYPYFDMLKDTINELGLHEKPSHIWNLDETSFSKDPSKTKTVGLKGFPATRTISSPGKDNTTVLLGCNAIREKTPPLIVFKGKNVWDGWTSPDDYPGTVYAATSNGWMESIIFETFLEKVFLPTVGEKRPILLIYDGHSTHVGINIIEKAREAKITILKIPPHTSHLLQPLDLAVNKSFKDKWDQALVKWQRLNVGCMLPRNIFSEIIGKCWTTTDSKLCIAGFRKAGIYPFNKNTIPEDKFSPVQLNDWKEGQREAHQEEYQANITEPYPGPSSAEDQFEPEMRASEPSPDKLSAEDEIQPHAEDDERQPERRASELRLSKSMTEEEIQSNAEDERQPERRASELRLSKSMTEEEIQPHAEDKRQPERRASELRLSKSMTEEEIQPHAEDKRQPEMRASELRLSKSMTEEEIQPHAEDERQPELRASELRLSKSMTEEEIQTHAEDETQPERRTSELRLSKSMTEEEIQPHAEDETQPEMRASEPRPSTYSVDKIIWSVHNQNHCSQIISKNYDISTKSQHNTKVIQNKNAKLTILDDQQIKVNISFEELLLKSIKAGTTTKQKRTRVAQGAELITHDDVIKRYKLIEEEKNQKLKNKAEKKKFAEKKKKERAIKNIEFSSSGKNTKIKPKRKISTSESDMDIVCDDESIMNYSDYCAEVLSYSDDNDNIFDNTDVQDKSMNNEENYDNSHFAENQWLLVKFATKKTVKHYVGTVLRLNDSGNPILKYVRKSTSKDKEKTVFTFPQVDDISEVRHTEDIVCKLPNPVTGRRGQIIFKLSFKTYNIQ